MAGAKARAGIAVEILVKQDGVPPGWVSLKLLNITEDRPPSGPRRKIRESLLEISADTSQRFIICPEPVGHSTLNSSPKVVVKLLKCLDDQIVKRKPDRTAPV